MSDALVIESQTSLHPSHGLQAPIYPLAKGRTADVFAWGEGSVLKLFHQGFSPAWIALELKNSRNAHALGIPTPFAIGHAEWDQRSGIVFERVDGPTFYNLIQTDVQTRTQLGRLFFDVQQAIHRCELEELLPLQAVMAQQIQQAHWLPETLRREATQALQGAPLVNTVCHLDFHPRNVIMGVSGPTVIDWLSMSRGDPALDVVRTLLFLRHFRCGVDQGARIEFLNTYVELCHEAWCGRMEQLEHWQRPVAVWRLTHQHITDDERTELLDLLESPHASWFGPQ
jgi:tRNA A-37 threonylcarbamoyl transferase component Bud32